ncbi:MAG: CocE/NonD family hydrolase, partial [Halioglobus sp.]|nr:CocE/NonD family hydrolase [Halioglobus sp.]
MMRQILIALHVAVLFITAPVTQGAVAEDIQAWLDYDRPADYEAIVKEVRPAMRDGVTLSCYLAVPGKNGQAVSGKFPGIISNVNPYTLLERFFINGIKRWAEYGYQGLTCRVRGTGDSEGEYPYYAADTLHLEWSDSYDLVEWFAAQPGSNGRIGQEGASYGGLTAYQAAIGNPPHLVAIATEVAPGDFYLDHIYPGGIKTRRFTVDNWPVVTGMMNFPKFSPFRLWGEWIDHPTHDRYWDGLAVTPKLAAVEVPVLAISGWKDHLFRGGALDNYEMLVAQGHGNKTWLLAGPWEHE